MRMIKCEKIKKTKQSFLRCEWSCLYFDLSLKILNIDIDIDCVKDIKSIVV